MSEHNDQPSTSRRLTRAALSALMLTAALVAASPADAATRPHRACPTEDSSWCVWDARHMGNGKGRSFWTDRRGCVHYVSHAVAHRLWKS